MKTTDTSLDAAPATGTTSPLWWLRTLGQIVGETQCKLSGVTIPLEQGFSLFADELLYVREAGKRVWWVGNGGSVSICTHLSQDLLNKLNIKSQTLNDPSLMSCMANDYGYSEVYARPLKVLMDEGDLLIAISSSGNSKNILEAVTAAHALGARVVAFSSMKPNNALWNGEADLNFYLPTPLYGLAEVGHEALIHSVVETLFLSEASSTAERSN